MNCIDVSEWNGDINWSAVKDSGIDYAMIRCGFGTTGKDKYFEINLEGAKEAGIIIGVYFYSYAVDYDSAVNEANHCIDLIEDYKDIIKLPVFYDVEEEKNKKRIIDVCMGFINTMNYYGYNCGIYTPVSWYNAYFKDISTDYIWLAYLGDTKPEYCDIWQNSFEGSISGIDGNVDTDNLYNTDMQLLINPPEPKDDIIMETFKGEVRINYNKNGIVNIYIQKEE